MHHPMTPDERQQIKGKLALGGGGIPLVEGYDVVMRLLATVDSLDAECEQLRQAIAGNPPPGLRFVLDVEIRKAIDPLQARLAALEAAGDGLANLATTKGHIWMNHYRRSSGECLPACMTCQALADWHKAREGAGEGEEK